MALAAARITIAQSCPTYAAPTISGSVITSALTEASGIAASRRNPGVLWSHNDSGGSNKIYAIGYNGADLGTFTLTGSTAVDWEDIAIGPGPTAGIDYIYVADTGDNLNIRSNIKIYRVPEPTVNPAAPSGNVTLRGVQTITLAYPDGPRDAETLMIDGNGDIYVVTKRVSAVGRVYRAAYPQPTSGTIALEFVGQIPWGAVNGSGGATGGDISADGGAIIVRRLSNYSPAATFWHRAPGMSIADALAQPGCDLALPASPQGEAFAFAPNDRSLFSLSEGANQPIHYIAQVHRPGDVNGDEIVNVSDLLAVVSAWGSCPAPPSPPTAPQSCHGDFNGDDHVNVTDLLTVIGNWG
jgi:hypothetical protein